MIENVTAVTLETVVDETRKMKEAGWRFVTITGTSTNLEDGEPGDGVDLLYHFDKDLTLSHLRMEIPRAVPIPSVSGVYMAALLAENELQDLMAVKFENLALDFNRTLYLEDEVTEIPLVNDMKAMTKKLK